MSTFLEWLDESNKRDTKVRAVLRRSLSFSPGVFPAAFPYVERFLNDDDSLWRRQVYYLVAALWAAHWKEGRASPPLPIGKAAAIHQRSTITASTERRFIALLDSDTEQLPHRLRQMIALLKEHPIDFDALLNGLLYWQDEHKRTQNAWARDFYRTLNQETALEQDTDIQEETA
jgi:CRISPR system Cascade subunit CasB